MIRKLSKGFRNLDQSGFTMNASFNLGGMQTTLPVFLGLKIRVECSSDVIRAVAAFPGEYLLK